MSVADPASAVRYVEAHGGKVLVAPTVFEGRGTHALFRDDDGALFGVLKSDTGDPPDGPVVAGEFLWLDLFTRDPKKAAEFYRGLAGYDVSIKETAPQPLRVALKAGGLTRAVVLPMPKEERCGSAVCRWINAFYGPTHHHAQLNQATHDDLGRLFGVADIDALNHISLMIRKGTSVDRVLRVRNTTKNGWPGGMALITSDGLPNAQVEMPFTPAGQEASLLDYQDVGVLMLLSRSGLSIAETPVEMVPRRAGHSRVFASWPVVARYMMHTTVLCLAQIDAVRRHSGGADRAC